MHPGVDRPLVIGGVGDEAIGDLLQSGDTGAVIVEQGTHGKRAGNLSRAVPAFVETVDLQVVALGSRASLLADQAARLQLPDCGLGEEHIQLDSNLIEMSDEETEREAEGAEVV